MNPEGYDYMSWSDQQKFNRVKQDPKPRYNCGDLVSIQVKMTVGNSTRASQATAKVVGVFYDANDMNSFAYDIQHGDIIFRNVSEKSL